MSVTCVIHEATDQQISELFASPEKIHAFIRWDPPKRPSWWDKLCRTPIQTAPKELPFLDLGRSAQAIHYVLTGTKERVRSPLGFLEFGGRYIGNEDVGYGPARALDSSRVKKVSSVLQAIPVEKFARHVNPEKMEPLHINGAPFPNDPEGLRYFLHDYASLREYMLKLSDRNHGAIIQYV